MWSSATVAGAPVTRTLAERYGTDAVERVKTQIDHSVRYANITIIEGTGASQFGIGVACARITEALLNDEHVVIPVPSHIERYGTTISLRSVMSTGGVVQAFEPDMSNEEHAALERSAETLRRASERIGVGVATAA